jgi:ribose transport system substrate-binding protein
MKRRTFLTISAVAAAGGATPSCNRNHKRQIAVIPKGSAHLFWQSVHAGANKCARENNAEVIWNGPATEVDYTAQLQIIDAMINRRVDAIALAPIDKKAMVSAVERAAREKIPVVIFDSGIDTDQFVSQVATDNFRGGELAADRIAKILDGDGEVAMVKVQPGSASTMEREDGFEQRVAKVYPNIRIVDARYGMADFAKSLAVAENMLTAHPKLEAIFASNESSTVGAVQALKQRKSEVRLVGFDSSAALIEDLKAGAIDSLVIQDPFRIGYESVKAALDRLDGKPVKKMNSLPPVLVDLENLGKPEIQAQLNPDLKTYL